MASRMDTASKSLTFLGGLAVGGLLTFLTNRDTELDSSAPRHPSTMASSKAVIQDQPHLWQPPETKDTKASTEENAEIPPPQPKQHVWIVYGPSGSGKTTMAQFMAKELGFPYLEGDDFHSPEAKEKMSNHHPLNDNDRWPWLERLRNVSISKLREHNEPVNGIVVTCSALKQRYRDVFRIASFYDSDVIVRFLFLEVSEAELMRRVRERPGHFMKEDMVKSQMEDLQAPAEGETDVVVVDVGVPPEEAQRSVLEHVRRRQKVDLV